MQQVLIFILLGSVVYFLVKYYTTIIHSVSDRYHHTFPNQQFSTQNFYSLTETLIIEKEIPTLRFGRVYHSMKGVLSAKREYLRVQYQEYFFDICAAPFAKDFFVSWRQGELKQFYLRKRTYKTFYEEDTELMFKNAIKLCVDKVIAQMGDVKGERLTEPMAANLLQ